MMAFLIVLAATRIGSSRKAMPPPSPAAAQWRWPRLCFLVVLLFIA